jgi:hypothetical protein
MGASGGAALALEHTPWKKPPVKPADEPAFEWTRSETFGLAKRHCVKCFGAGLTVTDLSGKVSPCNCVLRRIFRICLNRWRSIQIEARNGMSCVRYGVLRIRTSRRSTMYSRKNEEFCADFELLARRTLDPGDLKIFRLHFLWGADFRYCCRALKLNRGLFFHAVYRIEQKLGKVYRTTRPYSLFPLDEYFGGVSGQEPIPDAQPADFPAAA